MERVLSMVQWVPHFTLAHPAALAVVGTAIVAAVCAGAILWNRAGR